MRLQRQMQYQSMSLLQRGKCLHDSVQKLHRRKGGMHEFGEHIFLSLCQSGNYRGFAVHSVGIIHTISKYALWNINSIY